MLTYDAKFYLKNSITREDCIQAFTEWVREGKQNNCKNLKLPQDHLNYKYENDKIEFLIKTFDDSATSLTACRLTNLDEVGVFTVSVIFIQGQNGGSSTLLIQQDFESHTSHVDPPKYNRPYIVKTIFDKGWIDSSRYLSFGDKAYGEGEYYFNLTGNDIHKVAECLSGETDYDLPIVYISYDYPKQRYHLKEATISNIAKNLLGTAYVLVEPTDVRIIDKISRESGAGVKVFKGFIGIYFPKKDEYIYLRCNKNLTQTLNKIVWTLSIRDKSEEALTWEVLLDLCDCNEYLKKTNKEIEIKKQELERKKALCRFYENLESHEKRVISYPILDIEEFGIEECRNFIIETLMRLKKTQYAPDTRSHYLLEALSEANKETRFLSSSNFNNTEEVNALNIYAVDESFYEEVRRGEERLKELKNQLQAIESKLSKYVFQDDINLIIIPNELEEFFDDEINDIIMLCLEKAKRIDNSISENEHYNKIMEDNGIKGNGRDMFESIKRVLSKSDWDNAMQSQLEELGFTFTEGGRRKHIKAYFKDKRYSVTISCTPSEHRGGKNTAADIISQISIYN